FEAFERVRLAYHPREPVRFSGLKSFEGGFQGADFRDHPARARLERAIRRWVGPVRGALDVRARDRRNDQKASQRGGKRRAKRSSVSTREIPNPALPLHNAPPSLEPSCRSRAYPTRRDCKPARAARMASVHL